jgi:hypothetical protein
LEQWSEKGEMKRVLKGENIDQLEELYRQAKEAVGGRTRKGWIVPYFSQFSPISLLMPATHKSQQVQELFWAFLALTRRWTRLREA